MIGDQPWPRSIRAPLFMLSGAIASGLIIARLPVWFGVGTLIAVGMLMISLLSPGWIFIYLYPLIMRFGQIPFMVGGTTISLERSLLIVGGAVIALAIATHRLVLPALSIRVLLGLILWFGMYMAAWIWHPSDYGLVIALGYAQKAAMAYMVFAVLVKPAHFKTVLKVFFWSSLLLSFVTVFAYLQEGSLSYIREGDFFTEDEQSLSLFEGLARAGTANTMAVWVALLLLWQARHALQRWLLGIAVLWLVVVSLFALRREVLVTIPLGMAVLFLSRQVGRRRQILLIGMLLSVAAVAFLISSPEWIARLSTETVNQLSEGTDARLMLMFQFTPSAVLTAPLLGYGLGNYAATQMLFPTTVPLYVFERGGIAIHNTWSGIVVEAGLIAFLGFNLFLYGLGWPLWSIRHTGDRDLDLLWAFAPLIFVQLLLYMFFGNDIFQPATWFWFGFLLALERLTHNMAAG